MGNRNITLNRRRRGTTLLEVMVVTLIASTVAMGFGFLMYEVSEQIHMEQQILDVSEFGHYYMHHFSEKVRNGWTPGYLKNYGTGTIITRVTPPSEAIVRYIDPSDVQNLVEEWEFEYSTRSESPVIRINDIIQEYPYYPPITADSRDSFTIPSSSFLISRVNRRDRFTNELDDSVKVFKSYFTIEFDIIYERFSNHYLPRGTFTKSLHFSGGAYLNNDNWPVLKDDGYDQNED
jgi:hypothetical protein